MAISFISKNSPNQPALALAATHKDPRTKLEELFHCSLPHLITSSALQLFTPLPRPVSLSLTVICTYCYPLRILRTEEGVDIPHAAQGILVLDGVLPFQEKTPIHSPDAYHVLTYIRMSACPQPVSL